MAFGSLTLCAAQQSTLLALGGDWEVPYSRRKIDLIEASWARVQYQGNAGQAGIRVDYSLNEGADWQPLIPIGPNLAGNTMLITDWQQLPDDPALDFEVLVRAVATAAIGLTLTVFVVELQFR